MKTSTSSISSQQGAQGWLHWMLWVVQAMLALLFGLGGFMKMTMPITELAITAPWAADVGLLVRFIGLAEFAGAVGLVLPSLLRMRPALTPLAAFGLATVMLLAFVFHLWRGEFVPIVANLALAAVAGFVAWGRTTRAAIAPRRRA